MAAYLVMRLYGPLASWGEIAVGEMRHSAVQPSRSALIGLLAAALGIERDDEQAQAALAQGYRFAIKLLGTGSPLRDFHTVQTGVPARNERFSTRRQSLSASKLDNLLSTREYRCDSVAIVAIQAMDDAPHSLPALAAALRQPRFTLYLGRKSCPLAVPLMAQCIEAESVRRALDDTVFPPLMAVTERRQDDLPSGLDKHFGGASARYYWEDGMTPGMDVNFETVRHDQPVSRRRWQFSPRREYVHLSTEKTG